MPDNAVPTLTCANHPSRETMLRCNKCEKPICLQCAVLTEVGYRCKECVRGQQAIYFNAGPADLPIAAGIALILGTLAGGLAYALLGRFGLFSFLLALFVGPFVGGIIAEAVRRGVQRRRGRYLKLIAAAACAVGVLIGGRLLGLLLFGGMALFAGVSLDYLLALFFRLDVLLFAGLAASATYARLI